MANIGCGLRIYISKANIGAWGLVVYFKVYRKEISRFDIEVRS